MDIRGKTALSRDSSSREGLRQGKQTACETETPPLSTALNTTTPLPLSGAPSPHVHISKPPPRQVLGKPGRPYRIHHEADPINGDEVSAMLVERMHSGLQGPRRIPGGRPRGGLGALSLSYPPRLFARLTWHSLTPVSRGLLDASGPPMGPLDRTSQTA